MNGVLISYLVGVAIGLWRVEAPPLPRAALAFGWPVAIVACVFTLFLLAVAALVLFPWFGAAVVATGLLIWSVW